MVKNKGGRPRLFEDTPEDIEKWNNLMQGYIKSVTYKKDVVVTVDKVNSKGKVVEVRELLLDDEGNPIQELAFFAIPSFLGLVNYMGIGKDAVIEYSKKPKFSESYKEVMDIIQQYTADLLQTKNNVAGVIFTLKNNFGWQDKKELEVTSKSKLEDFFND